MQEFVNKYGLKRKDEEPKGGRMNDGEDEKEEPVKKHARHEEGRMPGSSSTDPMPMQEQSPVPTTSTETSQEEASGAGRMKGRGRELGGSPGEDPEEWSGQTARK